MGVIAPDHRAAGTKEKATKRRDERPNDQRARHAMLGLDTASMKRTVSREKARKSSDARKDDDII